MRTAGAPVAYVGVTPVRACGPAGETLWTMPAGGDPAGHHVEEAL
jgi:hypothetical protein